MLVLPTHLTYLGQVGTTYSPDLPTRLIGQLGLVCFGLKGSEFNIKKIQQDKKKTPAISFSNPGKGRLERRGALITSAPD